MKKVFQTLLMRSEEPVTDKCYIEVHTFCLIIFKK